MAFRFPFFNSTALLIITVLCTYKYSVIVPTCTVCVLWWKISGHCSYWCSDRVIGTQLWFLITAYFLWCTSTVLVWGEYHKPICCDLSLTSYFLVLSSTNGDGEKLWDSRKNDRWLGGGGVLGLFLPLETINYFLFEISMEA